LPQPWSCIIFSHLFIEKQHTQTLGLELTCATYMVDVLSIQEWI
jgi:hypothetical protein